MNPWDEYTPRPALLDGRVILITGTTRGIGHALALGAARLGATVLLHGRNRRALEQLHDDVAAVGPEPAIVQLDFERAQGSEYQHLTEQIESSYGRLDGLVHNASLLGDRSPIEHYDIGKWQRVMHVNVNAAFILTRCLLPLLKASEDASLVFTTSGVGNKGRAYWGAYSVSKFAIEGLTQILADELERTSVRVNCVNPGATRTSMRAQAYPAEDPATVKPPEDALPPYLFLLGPDSKGVNGQRIEARS